MSIQGRGSTNREASCRLKLLIEGQSSALKAWSQFEDKFIILEDDLYTDLLGRNTPVASSFLSTSL